MTTLFNLTFSCPGGLLALCRYRATAADETSADRSTIEWKQFSQAQDWENQTFLHVWLHLWRWIWGRFLSRLLVEQQNRRSGAVRRMMRSCRVVRHQSAWPACSNTGTEISSYSAVKQCEHTLYVLLLEIKYYFVSLPPQTNPPPPQTPFVYRPSPCMS